MTHTLPPYVRLAAAILTLAVRDASAARLAAHADSTMPTAADAADARAFMASHAALALAADLGLHPDYVRRLLAPSPVAEGAQSPVVAGAPSPVVAGAQSPVVAGAQSPPADAPPLADAWPSVTETARRFGYHPERVRWLIRAGRIQAGRARDGWGWRVNPNSVTAYRESLSLGACAPCDAPRFVI